MSTAITSQVVRIEFKRVSLTDDEIYFQEFDTLSVTPDIVDEFEKAIKADPNFTDVKRTIRTTL